MIPDSTKQKFKQMLGEEKERLEQDLHGFTRENKAAPGGHDSVMEEGQLEIAPEDQAEQVTEFEKRKTLETMLERRIDEIDHALSIIDTDAYGLCDVCHVEIPLKRLEVNPAATTCIDHAPRH